MSNEEQVIIFWHDTSTNQIGWGKPGNVSVKSAWAKAMNREYPHICHTLLDFRQLERELINRGVDPAKAQKTAIALFAPES